MSTLGRINLFTVAIHRNKIMSLFVLSYSDLFHHLLQTHLILASYLSAEINIQRKKQLINMSKGKILL